MKAKIGIDTSQKLVEIEMIGRIGYGLMNTVTNAPSQFGGGQKSIGVMKVWEGNRTLLIPIQNLAYIELIGDDKNESDFTIG
jgi:hypothetical protein